MRWSENALPDNGNVVLPLTQNITIAIIQALGAAESDFLSSTDLRDYLQERLLSNRDSIMPRSLIDQVLLDRTIPNAMRYREKLKSIWRSLCEEHGIFP